MYKPVRVELLPGSLTIQSQVRLLPFSRYFPFHSFQQLILPRTCLSRLLSPTKCFKN